MSRRSFAWTALVALTVATVAQTARVVFPLLYDVREDVGAAGAAVWAIAAFVLAPLVLALRSRGAAGIRVAVIAVAAARVAEQLIDPIPLWLGATAVALGLTAVALELVEARDEGSGAATAIAIVVGLALDSSLLGAFETWDSVWQEGVAATVVGIVVSLAAVVAAVALGPAAASRVAGAALRVPDAWPAVVVGPFLLLHVLFLQNIAFVTSETGVALAGGVALVLLGDAFGILLAAALVRRERSIAHAATGALLIVAIASLALADGEAVAVAQVIGSAASAAVLTLALAPPAATVTTRGRMRSILWFGLGTALFVAFAFAYQIDVDVPLPVPRATWPIAGSVVLAGATLRPHRAIRVTAAPAVAPVFATVGVPLLLAGTTVGAEPPTPSETYRVVDWNLHSAVDGNGRIALGEVASVIRSRSPDVVVLQEVARGWPIAGQADELEWLARELGMNHAWAPAADGQFGNAVLSPHPLDVDRVLRLPYGEGPQERSAIGLRVGTDPGLFVVGVHLQHGNRPATRNEQIRAVLETWSDTPSWVLAGDLNMRPGDTDLGLLEQAGLTSVQDAIGDPNASTARDPTRPGDRVDWIWATPDLDVANFAILESDASDHLPLVADVTP